MTAPRVLIAPQEFKGSLSAEEAAAAISAGITDAHPDWPLDLLPMSDGGPGFIDAMRRAVSCSVVALAVADPLGRPVTARYLVSRDSGDVFIEAAQANGLVLLAPEERNALRAGTHGVGQLIADAIRQAPSRIIIGVGGSATTDGGAGMAVALGAKLTSETGEPLPLGGGAILGDLARIDWTPPGWLARTRFIVATDVTNPLTGPSGAAAVYGPQKGASPEDVDRLDAALVRFAQVVRRSLGVDVGRIAGGGAAGGLAAGLVAFLGAEIVSGFDVVAGATNLAARMDACDIVVTGEGRFDSQSNQGKTTGRIIEMARARAKPVVVFAGASLDNEREVATLASLEPDLERAMAGAPALLRRLAAERFAGMQGIPALSS